MCGIFGYFDKSKKNIEPSDIEKMGQVIRHRGPDDQGIYFFEGGAIGNQRLSIIDVAGGHQPFISQDGQVAVVQNGEIFNHIELAEELKEAGYRLTTTSDTEVILKLYEWLGIDFVSKLNGMFSIAIYDKRLDCVFIIRDRVGVKPMYMYQSGSQTFFASEIKSFYPIGLNKSVSLEAINHYLSFNYIPLPWTIYKNVKHVMPGTYIKLTRHGETTVRWWNLADRDISTRSEREWIDLITSTLSDAVRIRLRADVPFGAFLSGGLDSSTIVSLMSQFHKQPIKTYCIGFENPKYDESRFAEDVAKQFKTTHKSEKFTVSMIDLWSKAMYHCDQPHGDISFIPTYKVSELAAKEVKMVLTGDGGDELFAGYEKYANFFSTDVAKADKPTFEENYFNNISLLQEEVKQGLFNSNLKNSLKDSHSNLIMNELYRNSQHMDRVNQALYIDTMQLLPGNNLVKADRMGMAASLEARTPFLDYRLVELAFSMPGEMKLKGFETKYILKKAVEPLIGKDLTYRKKQMFTVPVGDWFVSDLSKYCHNHLLGESSLSKQLFNSNVIEGMLSRHVGGHANYTRELRALLALEHWAQSVDITLENIF